MTENLNKVVDTADRAKDVNGKSGSSGAANESFDLMKQDFMNKRRDANGSAATGKEEGQLCFPDLHKNTKQDEKNSVNGSAKDSAKHKIEKDDNIIHKDKNVSDGVSKAHEGITESDKAKKNGSLHEGKPEGKTGEGKAVSDEELKKILKNGDIKEGKPLSKEELNEAIKNGATKNGAIEVGKSLQNAKEFGHKLTTEELKNELRKNGELWQSVPNKK